MAVEIVQIDTQDLTTQLYESQDTNLISTFDVNTSLSSSSYIEYFIYDLNQNLLSTEYNFTQYTVLNDGQSAGSDGVLSQITINPEQNLINNGFTHYEKFIVKMENISVKTIVNHLANGLYILIMNYSTLIPHLLLFGVMLLFV